MARRLLLPGLPWLLPLLIAFGVAGMHTLGHLGSHHGGAVTQGSHVHAASVESFGMDRSEPAICSRDAVGFDPSDVCLAVLTSAVALLIAVVWAAMLCWRAGMGGWGSPARTAARAPPRRPAPGLAVLSVMRI
ncbi:DUF6153 family protein [Nonomuraea jabiensis]|uniref:Uncharacterized protein n=1 Tax=Nonomuraea jabiensis TaxID=882448 RepID=A0A7W9GGQ6_9ACTN|nr:DUF6153 family protein [Nonomuraea jabiensis]MBB5783512.1 hypothetical protein [Nonomuraea jabiensis]